MVLVHVEYTLPSNTRRQRSDRREDLCPGHIVELRAMLCCQDLRLLRESEETSKYYAIRVGWGRGDVCTTS